MQTLPRPGLPTAVSSLATFFRPRDPALPNVNPPRAPEPTKEETRILELVDKRYEYARNAKRGMLERWATCLAFYVGEHYRSWNPRLQRLVQPTQIPEWRVRMTDNQIPGIIDTAAGKLGRSRKEPKALANTDEPEDHAAAEMGTAALRHWWDTDAMERKELECNIQRLLFGAGFFHDLWDPAKLAKVPIPKGLTFDPQQGLRQKTEVRRAAVGDITVEVLSVFDVFPEPVEDWDSVTWCVVARRKSLSWFRDTFPERGQWVTADNGQTEDVFSGLIPNAYEAGFDRQSSSAPNGDGQATLKVYYERPTRDYPKGRHAMVAGGRVLFARGELPLPHLEIPLALMGYRYVPKRLWPKGLVEELIGQQKELNRGQSNLAEAIRLLRSSKWIVPRGAHLREDAITSKPDEVIEYAGATPPQLLPAPNLPAQVLNYPEIQREAIRQLAAQHEVSEGQVPKGVSAAAAINLLQQADDNRLATPAKYGRQALQTLSTRVLKTISERWREDRLVSTFGRDKQQQIVAFQGSDIGDRDVLVDLTEGVADTDAVRSQQLTEWFQLGLFQMMMQAPPLAKLVPQLLRDVGQEWLADDLAKFGAELIPYLAQQEQQAQALQAQQAQGQQQAQQVDLAHKAALTQIEAQGAQQGQQQQASQAVQQMALQQDQAAQQAQAAAMEQQRAEEQHRQELAHQADRHRMELAGGLHKLILAHEASKAKERPAVGARK